MVRDIEAATNGKIVGSGIDGKITRDDIATKLRSITGDRANEIKGDPTKSPIVLALVVGGAIVCAYLLGRRKGGKGRAVVEIRRI